MRHAMPRVWMRTIATVLLGLASASCSSSTSRPEAAITMRDGKPCFSVAEDKHTKDGIPMRAITVTEMNTDEDIVQSQRWKMHIESADEFIISPKSCVRHGEAPTGGKQDISVPLKPYTTYFVLIDAEPRDPSLRIRGYGGVFCMQLNAHGQMELVTAPRASEKVQPFHLCKKPG